MYVISVNCTLFFMRKITYTKILHFEGFDDFHLFFERNLLICWEVLHHLCTHLDKCKPHMTFSWFLSVEFQEYISKKPYCWYHDKFDIFNNILKIFGKKFPFKINFIFIYVLLKFSQKYQLHKKGSTFSITLISSPQ